MKLFVTSLILSVTIFRSSVLPWIVGAEEDVVSSDVVNEMSRMRRRVDSVGNVFDIAFILDGPDRVRLREIAQRSALIL